MSLKAVLFDLDGTLLPIDQDVFIKAYFKGITAKLAPYGYKPEELVNAIWQGTGAMIKNDGSRTNEEAFWGVMVKIFGEKCLEDTTYFDKFYEENFDELKAVCGYNPKSAEVIDMLKNADIRRILATNPVFPSIATEKRTTFAGLKPTDFEFITSYENIGFAKPNPGYYNEILRRADLKAEDCLMVGNDVSDDMVAEKLGMKVFLLTDCLVNKENKDISVYPNGDFDALVQYIKEIM